MRLDPARGLGLAGGHLHGNGAEEHRIGRRLEVIILPLRAAGAGKRRRPDRRGVVVPHRHRDVERFDAGRELVLFHRGEQAGFAELAREATAVTALGIGSQFIDAAVAVVDVVELVLVVFREPDDLVRGHGEFLAFLDFAVAPPERPDAAHRPIAVDVGVAQFGQALATIDEATRDARGFDV